MSGAQGQGMKEMATMYCNHQALENSRKEIEKKFKEYANHVMKAIKEKYDDRIASWSGKTFDQTFGGRETGRLQINIELERPKIMWLKMDFSPCQEKGEIIYARHLAPNKKDIMPVAGIVPVVYEKAKEVGLSSHLHSDWDFLAEPWAVSFGGDYTEERLPEIAALVINMDNLIDLYLLKFGVNSENTGK